MDYKSSNPKDRVLWKCRIAQQHDAVGLANPGQPLHAIRLVQRLIIFFIMIGIITNSCQNPVQDPPPVFIVVSVFFKTPDGADLLNSATPNSFNKNTITVISEIEINGVVKEFNYESSGFGAVIVDNKTGFNCLQLNVPSNYGKTPIKTLIGLRLNLTDTLTYTFGTSRFKSLPDKIFYNSKQVWDINTVQPNDNWPPITVIK